MGIELVLCVVFMLVALPVSRWIAIHYLAFALVNWELAGVEYADSSRLALTFAALFALDILLIIAGAPIVLLLCATASAALAVESMLNLDYLLNHSTYISVAVNAIIGGTLAREYARWMRGKCGRS